MQRNSCYWISTFCVMSVFFFHLPLNSEACDCIMYPIEYYVDTSQYIFTGEVIQNLDTDQFTYPKINAGYEAKILVQHIFESKSIIKNDTVYFSSDSSDCSLRFIKGEKYLFFAHKIGNNFYIYRCSYSDKLNVSKKNIRKIKRELARFKKEKTIRV